MFEITEIKAKLLDYDATMKTLHKHCGNSKEVVNQEDIFFECKKGKLKLRIFDNNKADLIFYTRDKEDGIKNCKFVTYNSDDPEALKNVLSASFEIIGSVIKTRTLYLYNDIRIHIDKVKSLGEFIEIEIPINNANRSESGTTIQNLMKTFKIDKSHILEGAYIDLLRKVPG